MSDSVLSQRPQSPEDRYRLYLDESGDHVFHDFASPGHRHLCLLGCWFQRRAYRAFDDELRAFKQRHVPHDPDNPLILHREDIINRRGPFWRLRDRETGAAFDRELLELISLADFRIVAVVIDKQQLVAKYPMPAHPYHLAMGFMLQRYCGYLNHVNRCGDLLAESRGGREDRLLKDSYARVYNRGVWKRGAMFFQQALTSKQLKIKPKTANIAGLQLADLLGNPIRKLILLEKQLISGPMPPFAERLCAAVDAKFNRQLYDRRVWGYGKVLFPEQ